ncbi:ABC transporter permease [Filibacter tadaridae]|uniref:ABC-2 family transporter protein n=1 Tax=Filibacter tadaridae TaxID=2483811 RepID=A0A3P5WDI8_9BACL|nr:ABC transporter permease [Filibacter tadaridae]VDC21613.1 ABC-2 family transporter protein [Filibacter tadaridae]
MLNLIQNEWMKLWSKKGTWLMTGLLILAVIGMMGLAKWIDTMESGGSQDWKTNVKQELTYTNESLEGPNLPADMRENFEEDKKVLEYRLEHSIAPLEGSSREKMIMNSSTIGSFVVLLTVIVAAGIVAVEFSQGTIKMLLSRPIKRWKILTSKFVTVNLFGIMLMLLGFAISILAAYLLFPSSGGKELVWNGSEVVTVSVWGKGLYMLLLSFGNVFVTSTFAFMVGSVFRSNGLAIGLSLFIYFTGSTVVMLLSKYEIAKYIVFTHMDLTQYATGYQLIEGITMPFSLAVLAVYIIIFLVISYIVFGKRDVTA